MNPVKAWPVLVSLLVGGCSLQHHIDRAERVWLSANSLNAALHSVTLHSGDYSDVKTAEVSFLNAGIANTYLRGQLQSHELDELSGIAPIIGERDKYWAINDSGNRPRLFAINASGRQLATINVEGFNRDWEDLASFEYNDETWIAISESGDNMRRHAISSIYFFRQPDIKQPPQSVKPAYRLDYSYQDGPKNVESMAVSAAEGKIYLIAKDSSAANIYTMPLVVPAAEQNTGTSVVAQKVGTLADLQSTDDDTWWERWFAGRFLLTATSLDFSHDNQMAVVSNYRHVYLFKRRNLESWAVALSREPVLLTTHRMEQSESVAFSADAREVIVSSEGVGAPVLAIRPSAKISAAN